MQSDNSNIVMGRQVFWLLGFCLLVSIAGNAVQFFKSRSARNASSLSSARFVGPVPWKDAVNNLNRYNAQDAYFQLEEYCNHKVNGVVYDTASIIQYIRKMPGLIKTYCTSADPSKYDWQVGFYPMLFRDGPVNYQETRLGFYIIPTQVNKITHAILDYHSHPEYYPQNKGGSDSLVYDQGGLFP